MTRIAFLIFAACATVGCGTQGAEQPTDPKRDRFAEDREPGKGPAGAKEVSFDGNRAIKYLKQLCDLGPRVSGSTAMAKQQQLLRDHFEKHGATVSLQKFNARQPSRRQDVEMANMIISWHPERNSRVILCGHYDTRPLADQEPRRSDWTKPFASANDGTSTTALLMELGHHMNDIPTEVGVDFVLFDGEEYIHRDRFHNDPGTPDEYFLGSRHFADEYRKRKDRKKVYLAAILLDLFAGKDAVLPREGYSNFHAGGLVEMVWDIARQRGAKSFRNELGDTVRDDHLALNGAGIPAIDIIDFDYDHWHRLSDKPEQCSPEKMEEVAGVLVTWLQLMNNRR